ncbi:CoB--CoM heterodisulfide reductase iron-sulfur subunit A family protein [Desulfitibacter alkalitolerans]|uniref:CoB--CoM heterodisulfide reductase iron-sulfur subunit A family protein n=1 Tax=Desulfitibacter alkalitolerans TaxID=264641 RepID=UPI000482272D|nr:CoB--CoM heterodisulfide reductase iron-sulfur subunit A family protein [Desulfitibacter alkalitolerans]
MKRIGVFVCHCGSNIAAVVDVKKVAEEAKSMLGVVYSTDYQYMCSEPGQDVIIKAVKEHNLNRVVVAACSPRLHEPTFRKTLENAGLNPYYVEMANLREHCSWVHPNDKEGATLKSIDLVRKAVAKVNKTVALFPGEIPVEKRCLVIGGGIAGMQTAIDVADMGYEVIILEREATIGGKMAILDKTFPTMDCSACICTPKMVDAAQHPNIKLYTLSELESVGGYVGNFEVTIRKKARYVDMVKCTGCGICEAKCPKKVESEFDYGMGKRPCIYKPFPQAVPNKPMIDPENCRKLKENKCGVCAKVCPTDAVNFEDKDELVTERFGAIVMATGYELYDWKKDFGEYGYGKYPDVIDGLQFERLVNASGPTMGKIKRPSDGEIPQDIVIIKCVGSRSTEKGKTYCSKICCMYTAKHATQILEKNPNANVYIFYMDVRTPGKMYDEFYMRAKEGYGATYLRGQVSKIYQEGKKLIVKAEDTLVGKPVEVKADMVILATAAAAVKDSSEIAQTVGFSYDKDGFFTEAHPKLRPIETNTAGVFLAGTCQGPKDIPETVSQATAAAAKVGALFSKDKMATSPMISYVDEGLCSGCGLCIPVCPYKAIELITIKERVHGGEVERQVANVNAGLCQGCGPCTVACRSGAINLRGFTNQQILAEVDAACQ